MALQIYKIATSELTADTASITFSNIPQGYTDLKLVVSSRTTNAAISGEVDIQFNGLTTNLSAKALQGSGSAAASYSLASRIAISDTSGATATANTFGSAEVYIPNYTSANNKSMSIDGIGENNATAAYAELTAGLWSSTAAITSLTVISYNALLTQYTTATLYGIL